MQSRATKTVYTKHLALTSYSNPASQHGHWPGTDSPVEFLSPGHDCERDPSHLRSQRWTRVALRARAHRATEPLGSEYAHSFQDGSGNSQHWMKHGVHGELRGFFQESLQIPTSSDPQSSYTKLQIHLLVCFKPGMPSLQPICHM